MKKNIENGDHQHGAAETENWQMLGEFLRENLPAKGAPFRVGQPVGGNRLGMMFAELRRSGRVEVIGRPGFQAPLELIPTDECAGIIILEGPDRLKHVHSDTVYYGVRVRTKPTTKNTQISISIRPKQISEAQIRRAFLLWADGKRVTRRAADAWAKENGYPTLLVRRLASEYNQRGPGRPRKT